MTARTIQPYTYDWFDPKNRPDYSHIVTEDDEPVDNTFSEKQQRLLTESLFSSSWTERDFVVFANVGLFHHLRRQPVVPDMMLSMDVVQLTKEEGETEDKHTKTYFIWEYGKPPDVVIEIVSNRKGNELSSKVDLYEQIGVPVYIVFDPDRHLTANLITAFRRPLDNPLSPYEETDDLTFPTVGLALMLWDGVYENLHETWLRWCALDGDIILSGLEGMRVERGRANAERERAERYRQMLIAAGIDPDSQT